MIQARRILIVASAVVGVISTGAMFSTPAHAQDKEQDTQEKSRPVTAPIAKVTPVQAMKAAESKVGGRAAMAMFEFDEGHWNYGVVVVNNHHLMEVDVDPVSGKAGDSEAVKPDDEAKEFRQALAKLLK